MSALQTGRRVVVTGLGLVTPLGVGWKHVWRNLIDGQSGIVSLSSQSVANHQSISSTSPSLRNPAYDYLPQFDTLTSTVAGLVPYGPYEEGRFDPKEWLNRGDERLMPLFTQYAIAAAEQALTDAQWKPTSIDDLCRTGVCIGSGIGSIQDVVQTTTTYQTHGARRVSPLFCPRILINMAAGHVSMKYGFQGPNHAASTACTTGVHSIGDASRFIMFGDADVIVAGGTEACVHPLAMAGFARARSLSSRFNDRPTEASRPFDPARDGFVIGEGSGMVVLEELEHARRRGAPIYAEVKGYGLSADAHHITAPPEDGRGAQLAMQRALRHAGLCPSDIEYINAHATSTPLGDMVENRAIRTLFTDYPTDHLAVSSTKGSSGHLLGAAGAIEAIFTILAVHTNTLPPTLNLDPVAAREKNEEFTLNYVPKISQVRPHVNAALTNSFGFGGTNASLCITKVGRLS